MPLNQMDFPPEVQTAFFMYDLLSDVYEGMSGTYMGKDWSHCDQLFKLWEVEAPKITMYFMKFRFIFSWYVSYETIVGN